MVDLDENIDGIRHLFDVMRHTLTGQKTNAIDMHEVLLFTQGIDPGYELRV